MSSPTPTGVNITASDVAQLVNLWFGGTIARPARRRMLDAGILQILPTGRPGFTHSGWDWMVENAPRSKWSPPKAALEKIGVPPRANYLWPAVLAAAIMGDTRR